MFIKFPYIEQIRPVMSINFLYNLWEIVIFKFCTFVLEKKYLSDIIFFHERYELRLYFFEKFCTFIRKVTLRF